MHSRVRSVMFLVCFAVSASALHAQPSQPVLAAVDRVFRIGGVVPGVAGPAETIGFAIFDSESGGLALWSEVQTVAVDSQGRYSVLLGSTDPAGLPVDLFATGEPRWLSTQVQRAGQAEQPRSLLTSVPYALTAVNAGNADALGGRPATDFMLVPSARSVGADGSATTANAADHDPQPLVNNGTANYIGKFFNNVDLINSSLYDAGGTVGLNTTTPLDVFHSRFTNTTGTQTGIAVQNLGNTATSYSGMLFYDHTGALRQFQGYNNSTGEYRINNISPTGTINFMVGSTSAFKVDNSRNVGIGQATPGYKLDVLHGGATGIRVQSSGSFSVVDIDAASGDAALRFQKAGVGQWNIRNRPADDYLEIFELGGGSRVVVQNATGYVGIGGNPTVPLDVVGAATFTAAGTTSYFLAGFTNLTVGANTGWSTSIRASSGIVAGAGYLTASDERIKNIQGRSDGATDLRKLRDIEITDYLFKDAVDKGSRPQKKVIAQQVEKVFPEAVKESTDVVPDIYQKAHINNGWVELATDLKVGDRVRLITEAGHKALHEVLEAEKGRFRTDFVEDAGQVFVYGREVKDFRVVDYEAIAMLNVSATQELSRRLEQQATETVALRQELAEMRTALTAALEVVNAAKARQEQ